MGDIGIDKWIDKMEYHKARKDKIVKIDSKRSQTSIQEFLDAPNTVGMTA